jgi:hypothetical protein
MELGVSTRRRRPELVALASVGVGVVLLVAKLVVGVLTGSLGILSEAAHSLLDVVASVLALFAVRTARKPADREHPYGHGRAENLGAFAEGVILVFTAGGIAVEAVHRLLTGGGAVDPAWYAFGLLIATVIIESGRARRQRSRQRSPQGGRHEPRFGRARLARGACGSCGSAPRIRLGRRGGGPAGGGHHPEGGPPARLEVGRHPDRPRARRR